MRCRWCLLVYQYVNMKGGYHMSNNTLCRRGYFLSIPYPSLPIGSLKLSHISFIIKPCSTCMCRCSRLSYQCEWYLTHKLFFIGIRGWADLCAGTLSMETLYIDACMCWLPFLSPLPPLLGILADTLMSLYCNIHSNLIYTCDLWWNHPFS